MVAKHILTSDGQRMNLMLHLQIAMTLLNLSCLTCSLKCCPNEKWPSISVEAWCLGVCPTFSRSLCLFISFGPLLNLLFGSACLAEVFFQWIWQSEPRGTETWKYLVTLDDGRRLEIRWKNLLLTNAMPTTPFDWKFYDLKIHKAWLYIYIIICV